MEQRIFVIGAGAMAEAFIRGVTEQRVVPPANIQVVGRSRSDRLHTLRDTYGVQTPADWSGLADSSLVVIAVKPIDVATAVEQAVPFLCGQMVLSFAAGVTMSFLSEITGGRASIIRAMPNIPVAVLAGATAVTFAQTVPEAGQALVLHLLRQVGDVMEVDEAMMDAATAFTGSGPGFVCYFLEAMETAAVALGFAPDVARRMLLQTVVGTAKTLDEWGLSPAELRHRVTSPGGTTHAGVSELERGQLPAVVAHAMQRAAERSEQMGRQFAASKRA